MAYPKPTSHNPIMMLRGIAILSILWFHLDPLHHAAPVLFHTDISRIFMIDGMTAVWMLLIMSGYLMGKKWLIQNHAYTVSTVAHFYWNRFQKLAPAYYLIILTSIVYFRLLPFDIHTLIGLLTFQNTTLPVPTPMNALWFVSLMAQLYALFPIIWGMCRYVYTKSPRLMTATALVFPIVSLMRRIYIFYAMHPDDPVAWTILFHKQTLVVIDFFIMGILLNYIVLYMRQNLGRKNGSWPIWLSRIAILGVILVSANALYQFRDNFAGIAFFYATILPAVIMAVTGSAIIVFEYYAQPEPKKETHHAIWQFMHPLTFISWIGSVSYELYLVHFPIIVAAAIGSSYPLICTNVCTLPQFLSHYGILVTLSMIGAAAIDRLLFIFRHLPFPHTIRQEK